ncbi:MAG: alpha/beta fold hydrolase [Chloroflexota bacterium]|nr:alpha/beta fold hydrolase [Dehalococcoidia bacterium]MDW8253317.1 alpha/beta fold hydrolase [Chloroflexota bacterium]
MKNDLYHLIHRPARALAPSPALLVLHGWGADEHDLLGLAPLLDDRLLIISPRAPLALAWGYGWYHFLPERGADPAGFEAAVEDLAQFAASLPQRYAIDPSRFFVLGFSQGAIMGVALALAQPQLVRGAVLLSGRFPTTPVSGRLDGIPIFIGHGRFDPIIPATAALELEAAVRERGADVTLRLYDYGHEIRAETISDVNAWLAPRLPETG